MCGLFPAPRPTRTPAAGGAMDIDSGRSYCSIACRASCERLMGTARGSARADTEAHSVEPPPPTADHPVLDERPEVS